MKRINSTNISVQDGLNMAEKWLHEPKKTFMKNHKEELKVAYNQYDQLLAANPIQLQQIKTSIWGKNKVENICGKNYNVHDLGYKLYSSSKHLAQEHFKNLIALNNGGTITCPLCENADATDLDHYIPRAISKFPEYSIHLKNLIPLCHQCNIKKGDVWLDEKGERLIFNAFFDPQPPTDVFICSIKAKEGGVLLENLEIKISLNPLLLSSKKPEDIRIVSTINKLGLIKVRYPAATLTERREEIRRIDDAYKVRRKDGVSPNNFWQERKDEYKNNLKPPLIFQLIHCLFLGELIKGYPDVDEWIINHLSKLS